eukprot:12556707-Alexandrium_andersonii.AAC.1
MWRVADAYPEALRHILGRISIFADVKQLVGMLVNFLHGGIDHENVISNMHAVAIAVEQNFTGYLDDAEIK